MDIHSNVKLDGPLHIVKVLQGVLRVELSPFEWSSNVILIAYSRTVAVGTIKFREEDELMDKDIQLDIVQEFDIIGRPHMLAISQETLITSTTKVLQFAVASSDYNIYLFESGLSENSETMALKGHSSYINDIAFDKESSVDILASVSDDHTCRIWSVKTMKCKTVFYLQSSGVAVKWCTEEPGQIIVAEKRGVIRVYNVEKEETIISYDSFANLLTDIDWCPKSHFFVAALALREIIVFDLTKPSIPVFKHSVHPTTGACLRFSPQNENIIASIGSPGHTFTVTNLKSKNVITSAKLKVASNITWHYHLPYVCVGVDRNLCFWKVATK